MSGLPIRVLLIEDNPGDARLLHEMLNGRARSRTELTHFGCINDALNHLGDERGEHNPARSRVAGRGGTWTRCGKSMRPRRTSRWLC